MPSLVAEREGFEPSVPLLAVHTISNRAPSANSDISPGLFKQDPLAERVGFEPTIPRFTGYRFSRAGPSATRQPLPWVSGSHHNGHDPSSHNPFGILCQYARRLHFIACMRFVFLVSTSCSRGAVLSPLHHLVSLLGMRFLAHLRVH